MFTMAKKEKNGKPPEKTKFTARVKIQKHENMYQRKKTDGKKYYGAIWIENKLLNPFIGKTKTIKIEVVE